MVARPCVFPKLVFRLGEVQDTSLLLISISYHKFLTEPYVKFVHMLLLTYIGKSY